MGETLAKTSKLPETIQGKNGGTLIPITSATASDLAKRRWAKFRQAAAKRVTAEASSIDPTATTAAEAWGLAVAKQYTALLDSDKPRGDDLIRIGQAMGAVPTAHETQAQQAGATHNTLVIGDEAARMIAEAIARVRGE